MNIKRRKCVYFTSLVSIPSVRHLLLFFLFSLFEVLFILRNRQNISSLYLQENKRNGCVVEKRRKNIFELLKGFSLSELGVESSNFLSVTGCSACRRFRFLIDSSYQCHETEGNRTIRCHCSFVCQIPYFFYVYIDIIEFQCLFLS